MIVKTVYFEKPGRENTEEVFRIVQRRAKQLGIKTIIVGSSTGATAVKAAEFFKGIRVVAVGHYTGRNKPNLQEFTEERQKKVISKGGAVFFGTHVFAGISRAIHVKFDTLEIGEIFANVLRIFGQGMKVVVEITLMATDAGLANTGEDVIAIAGTGRGADTAVVIGPANSSKFFDIQVREILCKPRSFKV